MQTDDQTQPQIRGQVRGQVDRTADATLGTWDWIDEDGTAMVDEDNTVLSWEA